MSRAQQGAVNDAAAAENSSYNTNAQDAYKKAEGDLGSYADAVGAFGAANPYVQGGAVQTADNQATADTAAGMAQSAGESLQGSAVRTGQNAGGAIAATEHMQDQNDRNLVAQEAAQTKDRAASDTGYRAAVVGDTGNIQNMQDALATQQSNAAQGALNIQEQAAQTPSFMDELGQGLITGGGQAGSAAITAFCPAEGSLYYMADGTEKPVESLKVGELLGGIDGEPELIEEIQTARSPILRVETDDGFVSRSSRVHAFAQPIGGFVVAMHSMGKTILTAKGRGKVVSVTWDGEATVYNLITDGSHTYRADGIWALGVGEAERHVSMDDWNEIGDKITRENGELPVAVTDGGR